MTPTMVGLVLVGTTAAFGLTRHRWTRFVIVLILTEIVGLAVVFIQLQEQSKDNWGGNLVTSSSTRAWNVNLTITSQKPISRISVQWTVPQSLPLPPFITETFD